MRIHPEDAVAVFDLRPLNAALLNSQLLTESKVFKNYIMFALKYELWTLKDKLGKDFQCCLPPNIPIEFYLMDIQEAYISPMN